MSTAPRTMTATTTEPPGALNQAGLAPAFFVPEETPRLGAAPHRFAPRKHAQPRSSRRQTCQFASHASIFGP